MPYTAIYPPGVYSYPSMASPSTPDVPAKSSNIKDRGLMKKLKGFDSLAVSIGNVNADITVGDGSGQSQSGENGAEGSNDASDENNDSGGKENRRKRSSDDAQTSGDMKANAVHGGETNGNPDPKELTCPLQLSHAMGTLPAFNQTPAMEFRTCATSQLRAGDEKELKRERRKQSNRESARRSGLRKQAETEELAIRVENLGVENTSLRSEINRFEEDSEKLKAENSSLLWRLKNVHNISPDKTENQEAPSVVVENFLSRIDKLRQDESHENSHGGKLHQLLDSKPITDAMAAG